MNKPTLNIDELRLQRWTPRNGQHSYWVVIPHPTGAANLGFTVDLGSYGPSAEAEFDKLKKLLREYLQ